MYNKAKIFEQAKEVIVKHKLFFMDEVPDFLPCGRSTFYDFFPNNSDELDNLKQLISINKTQVKTAMRSKWYTSNAPALQMALMKLIATPEELKKLSMTFVESENTNRNENFDIGQLYDSKAQTNMESTE